MERRNNNGEKCCSSSLVFSELRGFDQQILLAEAFLVLVSDETFRWKNKM